MVSQLDTRHFNCQRLHQCLLFYACYSQKCKWSFVVKSDFERLFFSNFQIEYRKVANSKLSRLVACLRIFRLLMKGGFDDYVLWPLAKRVKNRIVDQSTARDFTVFQESRTTFMERKQIQVVQYNCMDSTAYRNCAELWSVCTQSLSCILLFPRKSCLSARIG